MKKQFVSFTAAVLLCFAHSQEAHSTTSNLPKKTPAKAAARVPSKNSVLPVVSEDPPPKAKSGKFSVMSVGVDYRAERDADQSAMPRPWPTFAFGLGVYPWLISLEYARFNESSGNSTLSVTRKAETLIVWGQWFADEAWPVLPYMGIGIGAFRSSADMNLYTESTSAQGKWIEHAAGSLGLKLTNVSPFWLAVEGRVHMNRELDPSPTVSAMFRLGFVID